MKLSGKDLHFFVCRTAESYNIPFCRAYYIKIYSPPLFAIIKHKEKEQKSPQRAHTRGSQNLRQENTKCVCACVEQFHSLSQKATGK